MKEYDIVVIGTGAGGSTVAYKCSSEGWKVAVVDSNPYGGTCALRGCDPKKVLIAAAEVVDSVERFKGTVKGVEEIKIDWPTLMKFKRSFTDPVPENREKGFKKAGIDTYHGRAHFAKKDVLQVGDDLFKTRYVMIAAGAKPLELGIEGEEYIKYSDEFLELDNLPSKIIFIGGGYISFEFANISARAGANPIILHRSSRPLKRFDQDLVKYVVKSSEQAGIKIKLEAPVKKIEKKAGSYIVHTTENGKDKLYEADLVVHGAGRVPDIEDMALDIVGVEFDKRGIIVNEYMQSVSNPNVYAAGDAASTEGFPLTPVASMEAYVASHNIIHGNERKPNYKGIPTVVFTMPPLASVGLTEAQAKSEGYSYKVIASDTENWYTSRRLNIKNTGFKTIIEDKTGIILGAHICGAHSEEVINLFAQAIRNGLTSKDMKIMLYAYPTASSDLGYMV